MENPFSKNYPDSTDTDLVAEAVAGDKQALQNLILRHQPFIYNLAFKMSRDHEDAEDLTQEVFIKAITSLARFEGKSSFRTWIYRITVNHFINSKKRKNELQVVDFETYFNEVDLIPDQDLNKEEQMAFDETIEDIKISCTSGMLLCLNREQRLIYLLGELFEIDHRMGSEIMGISPGYFRIQLMRARKDLSNWMEKRCGLVNSNNPCRCAKKTRALVQAGKVDPGNLKFNRNHRLKIHQLSESIDLMKTTDTISTRIFKNHPFIQPSATKIVNELYSNKVIKNILSM